MVLRLVCLIFQELKKEKNRDFSLVFECKVFFESEFFGVLYYILKM